MTTDPDDAIFSDLTKLAVKRCHAAFMGVAQLMDDRDMAAAIAIVVAAEFMIGAEHNGMSRVEVFKLLAHVHGQLAEIEARSKQAKTSNRRMTGSDAGHD